MSNSTMFALVIRLRKERLLHIYTKERKISLCFQYADMPVQTNRSCLQWHVDAMCLQNTFYHHHSISSNKTKFWRTNLRVYPINIPYGNNDETVIQISHSYRVIRAWVQSTSNFASTWRKQTDAGSMGESRERDSLWKAPPTNHKYKGELYGPLCT